MENRDLICKLANSLLARHQYQKPIPKDVLINLAGISTDEQGRAKQAFDQMRGLSFIESYGPMGIMLDNGEFGDLADFLFWNCDHKPIELRTRLKHYEGWQDHDWA